MKKHGQSTGQSTGASQQRTPETTHRRKRKCAGVYPIRLVLGAVYYTHLANKRFVLVTDDAIYKFLSQDINNYTEKYEVLVTDNFKTKEIRQPKLGTVGVKIENNLLNIDLTGLDFDRSELKEILAKYNLKKK